MTPNQFHLLILSLKLKIILRQLSTSLPAAPEPASNGHDKSKRNNKKKTQRKHDPWKFVAPKNNEPHTKVQGKSTYHQCPKPHADGKPMGTVHKPEDHGTFKQRHAKQPPSSESPNLELQEQIRSMLSLTEQDFSQAGNYASKCYIHLLVSASLDMFGQSS